MINCDDTNNKKKQNKTTTKNFSPPDPKDPTPPPSLSISLLTFFWRCWAADKHVSKHLKLKKKKSLINGVALLCPQTQKYVLQIKSQVLY